MMPCRIVLIAGLSVNVYVYSEVMLECGCFHGKQDKKMQSFLNHKWCLRNEAFLAT